MQPESVSSPSLDEKSVQFVPEKIEEVWFDEPTKSSKRPSTPPPEQVGEFLGDPLADAWLR